MSDDAGNLSTKPFQRVMIRRVSERDLLEDLFEYVGFDDQDAATLLEIGPLVSPRFDEIIDRFYEVIARTPRAAAAFREGQPQIARQKKQLAGWLESIFGGVYDGAYLARRERIGRAHVRMRLEQRYMFASMSVVRSGLHHALRDCSLEGVPASSGLKHRGHLAIDRICDVELAIMLETYRDRYVEQQRAQERLATIGQLAASIGHELRNPLAVISTSAHLLRKRVDTHGARHIDKIVRQVEQSERIIGDLLALAGDRGTSPEPIDLIALVEDVRASLVLPEGIDVVLDLDPSVQSVSVDGSQVRQMLLNLLINAMQAVETGGGGRVEVRATLEDGSLSISVLDDGPGFPTDMRRRVFEPLFTTTGRVGLGLALCARIVAKHGGTIEALDREGGGAHVRVQIPQASKAP